jgi:tRNA pseudouridine38-40 synthase
MPRLKLTLAYVGTRYCGWQVQAWTDRPHPPTVQAEVEKAVSSIVGAKTHVQGAGRTDSGVHADGQVAHCDIPESRSGLDWQRALHTRLPKDIRVVDARIVPATFVACFGAVRKAYIYRLWLNERFTPPCLYPFVWACGALDMERVDAAIPHLVGTHDFRSVQNAGTDIKTTVRTLYVIERTPGGKLANGQAELELRFEANGFLKQMVRNLAGLLVACGRGKFEPDAVPALLLGCDRRLAPVTAPPQGLTLSKIWYAQD